MKYSRQFWLIFSLVMISSILISALSLYTYKENIVDNRKRGIESILHFARAQALVFIDQTENGFLTREEAEERLVEMLGVMNVDSRYVWANDNHAVARVHLRPEIIGKFQRSYIEHMKLLDDQEIIFISETNIKPISNKRVLKINGVIKVPKWDWVIGYGVYMDDVEQEFLRVALRTMLINALIALVAAFVSVFVIRLRGEGA